MTLLSCVKRCSSDRDAACGSRAPAPPAAGPPIAAAAAAMAAEVEAGATCASAGTGTREVEPRVGSSSHRRAVRSMEQVRARRPSCEVCVREHGICVCVGCVYVCVPAGVRSGVRPMVPAAIPINHDDAAGTATITTTLTTSPCLLLLARNGGNNNSISRERQTLA